MLHKLVKDSDKRIHVGCCADRRELIKLSPRWEIFPMWRLWGTFKVELAGEPRDWMSQHQI